MGPATCSVNGTIPPGIDEILSARPPNSSVDVAHASSDSEHVSTGAFTLEAGGAGGADAGDAWQPVAVNPMAIAIKVENTRFTGNCALMFPLFGNPTGLSSASLAGTTTFWALSPESFH